MANFSKDSFASFDEFMSLSDCKNKRLRNVFKTTLQNNEMTSITASRKARGETVNNDFGLTSVPFAR